MGILGDEHYLYDDNEDVNEVLSDKLNTLFMKQTNGNMASPDEKMLDQIFKQQTQEDEIQNDQYDNKSQLITSFEN